VIVPIWIASWELGCCQPQAEVGKPWIVPVSFDPTTDPWWVVDHGAAATAEQRSYGVADLDVRSENGAPGIYTAGPLRFHGPVDLTEGHHTGRLHVDAHSSDDHQTVTTGGPVTAVDLIPLRFTLKERDGRGVYCPTEQLEPVRVGSTRDGSDLNDWVGEDTRVICELLIWVDVGG